MAGQCRQRPVAVALVVLVLWSTAGPLPADATQGLRVGVVLRSSQVGAVRSGTGSSGGLRLRLAPAFVLPVPTPGVVLTPFRAPATAYGPGHRGVDLALAVGAPVVAAGSGVVTHAGLVAGRGTVTIEHPDGLSTTYEPLTAEVHTGQQVSAGQPIGVLEGGHPSCAPAACLHWGARLPDGEYLDPMGLINGLDVRLLPWDQARG